MTDLLLVRHGQATHNVAGRWEGWGPTPLTRHGRQQAKAVARRLASSFPPITRVYSSPLLRAWQTAKEIGRELELVPLARDDLKEINFGQVSGLTLEGFRTTMPELFDRWKDKGNLAFQYPGGEQRLAFFERVGRAVDDITAMHPAEQVVIVAHGGTLRAALAHLFPETMKDWWTYTLQTASLTHAGVRTEGNNLLALNDCQHLDGRVNR
jgi:broad specificity phosphatase PhoE